jgi:hypothetical protein
LTAGRVLGLSLSVRLHLARTLRHALPLERAKLDVGGEKCPLFRRECPRVPLGVR